MTTVSSNPLPFQASYQPGYRPGSGAGTLGPSGGSAQGSTKDIIDIRVPPARGSFTAEANDSFSLRDLIDAGGNAFDNVARYRVALRDDPAAGGGGRLLLRGTDVTTQVDFTPAEFNELLFRVGSQGSRQDLLVVARTGQPDGQGGLAGIVDSAPVQITASVTGTRSIEAATALRTQPGADEADFVKIVQDAALFSGLGKTRPGLTTVGNFTAEAGDSFSLRELFDAGANAFDSVARYRVALREDPAAGGGGRLLLRGTDVTAQLDFTPAEFNELQFVAGPDGSSQDVLVVARAGRPDGQGGLLGIIDSPAVQITASVTGSRSINAAEALRTTPGADEADFLRVVQDAGLFSGLGKTRPDLATVGNFTAVAGDSFSLRELFDAGANTFDSVARYRVALREDPAAGGAGRLLLRGADVTSQVDFTPAEFNELQFVAGPNGSSQDLVVVARAGRPDGQGGLLGIIDSPAVQITAGVTGSRSINAAAALRTEAGPADAVFLGIAQESSLFAGFGKPRPGLATVGNFTAEAGDSFALRELYEASGNAAEGVARYRVALRAQPPGGDAGRLLLGGTDVTAQLDFTPAEFTELQFVAGRDGSSQDLLVVARAGRPDGQGGLVGIVDSPAVQITASVTGSRSINAAAALRTAPGADEADFLLVAQDSSLYAGLGATRPALGSVGNFTAEADDAFSLRELYGAGGNASDSVARYRVALREDAAGGGGRLLLRGADVTGQVDFTPGEFNELLFVAGPSGSRQDLLVVARSGRPDGAGGLLGIIDSPAVQIAASVTGSRSINAAAALRTAAGPDEADFVRIAQEADLFSGLGRTRPALRALVPASDPAILVDALSRAVGAFLSTGTRLSAGAAADAAPGLLDLRALYGTATGSSRVAAGTPGLVPDPVRDGLAALLALLGEAAIGGSRTAGDGLGRQSFAIQAYQRTPR